MGIADWLRRLVGAGERGTEEPAPAPDDPDAPRGGEGEDEGEGEDDPTTYPLW